MDLGKGPPWGIGPYSPPAKIAVFSRGTVTSRVVKIPENLQLLPGGWKLEIPFPSWGRGKLPFSQMVGREKHQSQI